MNKLYSLMCAAMLGGASTAFAAIPPFQTTQLVNGQFADSTRWYTMTISNQGYLIGMPATGSPIALNNVKLSLDDQNLWCFVGNATTGYKIYNKAAGPGKFLVSPATMYGDTGGTAYVTLADTLNPGTNVFLWDFSASAERTSDYASTAVYMSQHGKPNNAANNRDGKLAFWTGGKDAGSSILIEFGKQRRRISQATGSFTKSNTNRTWHAEWTEAHTSPKIIVSVPVNNMNFTNGELGLHSNSGNGNPVYNVKADDKKYVVSSYSLNLRGNDASFTAEVEDGPTVSFPQGQTNSLSVAGENDKQAPGFLLKSSPLSRLASSSDFYATVARALVAPEPSFDLFQTPAGAPAPYRIPALAVTRTGRLLAFSDYRPDKQDIGYGRVHIRFRYSDNNGKDWTEIKTICQGTENLADGWRYAYGDPAAVADAESDEVLLIACAGTKGYPKSTNQDHLFQTRWRSHDGGLTWDQGENISEQIYALFANETAPIDGLFFSSGRILQSKYIKAGTHYRIYSALCTHRGNFVLYSDDFGANWKVLGGATTSPISSGNEAKCEELPDGSVVLSSRADGSRLFNIFTYTKHQTGEGAWGLYATSNRSNSGIVPQGNGCNGEILILPAKSTATQEKTYVALQSIPFGTGRSNVGVYFKTIGDFTPTASPQELVKNWTKGLQVSRLGSAYSTMMLQKDDSIGFMYEEETYGVGYNIVYKKYSLEQLTDSLYELDKTVTPDAFRQAAVDGRIAGASTGKYVGQLRNLDGVNAAKSVFQSSPSLENMEAVSDSLMNGSARIKMEEGRWYRFVNKQYGNALSASTSRVNVVANDPTQLSQLFQTEKKGEHWALKQGQNGVYMGTIGKDNVELTASTNVSNSGVWKVESYLNGVSTLQSTTSLNKTHPWMHEDRQSKIVGWESVEEPSKWNIEPVDSFIVTLKPTNEAGVFMDAVCYPFAFTADSAFQVVSVADGHAKMQAVEAVPESAGILLRGTSDKMTLRLTSNVAALPENLLQGTLSPRIVAGALTYNSTAAEQAVFKAGSTTVAANRAYLTGATGPLPLVFDNVATGIHNIDASLNKHQKETIFDLSGRRASRTAKGVLIINGQKSIH